MPRLLLVDDNPSIHRIAESLLAPTAIELVCVDSAAEALDRIQNGERFDVAMVDTAMPGMDGWTLVERLRGLEATARMPIALMAGVLDPVDPQKLERAPIQGFLKKPIELRELADRVHALMATPVGSSAPVAVMEPLATQPISREEAQAAIAAFPDFTPTIQLPDEGEEDLLILTAADLFPEEAPAAPAMPEAAAAVLPEPADLELEELDLEGLQGLSAEVAEPAHHEPVHAFTSEPTRETPPMPELETLGSDELASLLETDLGPSDLTLTPMHEPVVEAPEHAAFELPELEPVHFELDEPEPLAAGGFELPPVGAPMMGHTEPNLPEMPLAELREEVHAPEPHMAAPIVPAAPVMPEPASAPMAAAPVVAAAAAPAGGDAASTQALVQALLADPQAMAQLTKALVTQMGQDQLKAIAWEVLPDLAKKLS
jgi:CheY-like chemotaxis protein